MQRKYLRNIYFGCGINCLQKPTKRVFNGRYVEVCSSLAVNCGFIPLKICSKVVKSKKKNSGMFDSTKFIGHLYGWLHPRVLP